MKGESTMRHRCAVALAACTSLWQAMPTQACSPVLVQPLLEMGGQPPKLYARIVHAEVVAITAPSRRAELEVWRQYKREIAERNALAARKYQADAERAALEPRDPDAPPAPPPESPLPEPIPLLSLDVPTTIELFELEVLRGDEQGQTYVSAGGPCGSSPQIGHQYVVFIDYSGFAHFMQDHRPSTRQWVAPAFLQAVRACVQGKCPEPAEID
jgi:hypothetical protein